jgi:putative transposon-encoded protein
MTIKQINNKIKNKEKLTSEEIEFIAEKLMKKIGKNQPEKYFGKRVK